jgi:hypothetical protein
MNLLIMQLSPTSCHFISLEICYIRVLNLKIKNRTRCGENHYEISGDFPRGKATCGELKNYRVDVIRLVCFAGEESVNKVHMFRL